METLSVFNIYRVNSQQMFILQMYSWSEVEEKWIGCITSQLTIFQSYMWRHKDVQADWKRNWTYGRAPNAIDIS